MITEYSFENENSEHLLDARRRAGLRDSCHEQGEQQPEPHGAYIQRGETLLKCSLGGRDFKQVAGSYIEEKAFVGEVGELSRAQPQQVRRAREGGNTAAAVSVGGESIDSHHAPSTCSVPGITATQHLLCGVIFRDTV